MSYLVANLPPIQCFIKKEYLYDFEKGHGEFEPCYWLTVKSIRGKALYFESYLTNYGAVYDKLPISAYVWKTDIDKDHDAHLFRPDRAAGGLHAGHPAARHVDPGDFAVLDQVHAAPVCPAGIAPGHLIWIDL